MTQKSTDNLNGLDKKLPMKTKTIFSFLLYFTISPYIYSVLGIIGLIIYRNEKIELLLIGSIGLIMYVFIYPYLKIMKKNSLERENRSNEEKSIQESVENNNKKSLGILKRVYLIGNLIMSVVIILCLVFGGLT